VAGMLITMLRHSDRVKIACMAQLVNVIAPIMTSAFGAWKQTIYFPYEMISNYGRGKVLNTVVKTPVYESKHGDAPYLDAIFIFNEEKDELVLFAVNKDLEEVIEIDCDLRQFEGYQVSNHQILRHDDVKAVNTFDNPANVAPVKGSAAISEGRLSVKLADKSFHMIVISR